MTFFSKFYCSNFKNFIRNSKTKLENSLLGLDLINIFNPVNPLEVSVEEKVIMNLNSLTQEDKIVWSRISSNLFKGVLIENCTFSNYRIMLERELFKHNDIYNFKMNKPHETYRICLMKGNISFEEFEYLSESFTGKVDVICKLMGSIEKKLIQQTN